LIFDRAVAQISEAPSAWQHKAKLELPKFLEQRQFKEIVPPIENPFAGSTNELKVLRNPAETPEYQNH